VFTSNLNLNLNLNLVLLAFSPQTQDRKGQVT